MLLSVGNFTGFASRVWIFSDLCPNYVSLFNSFTKQQRTAMSSAAMTTMVAKVLYRKFFGWRLNISINMGSSERQRPPLD